MENTCTVDTLLSEQLIGAKVDRDLSRSLHGLDPAHPFSWESIQQDPKGDHGIVECRGFGSYFSLENSSPFLISQVMVQDDEI
jgi:hypothetical protein